MIEKNVIVFSLNKTKKCVDRVKVNRWWWGW